MSEPIGTPKQNQKNLNSFGSKVTERIKKVDTRVLLTAPFLLAGILALTWSYVAKKLDAPRDPDYLITIMFALLAGLGGFGPVIKQEFPSAAFSSVRGRPAIVLGVVWIVFWWGLALPGILSLIGIRLRF